MIGEKLCLAPIQSITSVSKAVDVGCGTGIATVQIVGMFLSATVYGLNILPVPAAVWKIAPANTTFVLGNVLNVDYNEPGDSVISREIFTPGGLDYIFSQMLFLGINNWLQYFSIASHALTSNGFIEHQDLDWNIYRVGISECLSDKWGWYQAVLSGAELAGSSTQAGSNAAPIMKAAGLEIVSVQTFEYSNLPSCKTPNSRAVGRYVQAKLAPQYSELLCKMLESLGITDHELEVFTKDCLRDIASEEGAHHKYTVTIARKPQESYLQNRFLHNTRYQSNCSRHFIQIRICTPGTLQIGTTREGIFALVSLTALWYEITEYKSVSNNNIAKYL